MYLFPNGLNLPEQGTQDKVPRTRYPGQGTLQICPAACANPNPDNGHATERCCGSLWHCRIAREYLYNYKCGYFQVSHPQCKIYSKYIQTLQFSNIFWISLLYLHLNMFRLNIHTFSTFCLGLFVG